MTGTLFVITHPEVEVSSTTPIPDWSLSHRGRARAAAFAASGVLDTATAAWSSAERKARETAGLIAPWGQPIRIDSRLNENDRSATGFLPPARFETAADAFFADPDTSHQGWETARAAQRRIVTATRDILDARLAGDIAIFTHGAVGTLLWCHFAGLPIDRCHDQPGQGHYFTADRVTLRPNHGWISIDATH